MSNESQNKEGQLIKEEQQKKKHGRLRDAVRRLFRKGITGIFVLSNFITVIEFILDHLG